MIFNLSAGDNTSEEVEVLLTELETQINTLMTELKSDVESMITGLNNDISSAVATLSTRGAVKRVQSGLIGAGTVTSNKESFRVSNSATMSFYIDVNLNPVSDINKCLVFTIEGESTYAVGVPKLLNENTLRVYVGSGESSQSNTNVVSAISWQVVEFY